MYAMWHVPQGLHPRLQDLLSGQARGSESKRGSGSIMYVKNSLNPIKRKSIATWGGMHKSSCGRLSKRRSNSPRRVLGLLKQKNQWCEKVKANEINY